MTESLSTSPGALLPGTWISSWYVVSIDTGPIAWSPQSSPRWSLAFKMDPVLFLPSLRLFASSSSFPAHALHTLGSANSEIQWDTWTLYTYTGCRSLLIVQGFSQRGTCWRKELINEWTNKPRPASGSSTYYFNFFAPTPFLDLVSTQLLALSTRYFCLCPYPISPYLKCSPQTLCSWFQFYPLKTPFPPESPSRPSGFFWTPIASFSDTFLSLNFF